MPMYVFFFLWIKQFKILGTVKTMLEGRSVDTESMYENSCSMIHSATHAATDPSPGLAQACLSLFSI